MTNEEKQDKILSLLEEMKYKQQEKEFWDSLKHYPRYDALRMGLQRVFEKIKIK